MKIKNPLLLIVSIAISNLSGFIGAFATTSSVSTWYVELVKPFFNPPSWIFGPVWTILYTLMGIALYLIWSKGYNKKNIKSAVNLFLVHLVFNTLWSIIFFGQKNLGLAFVVITILWLMIACLIKLFYKLEKKAAYLLLPYIAWVSFASLLNLSIWWLN